MQSGALADGWAALAARAAETDAAAPPPGWQLIHASRAAILFRVGEDILVKCARVVRMGVHVAPLARVAIEASAPAYLGHWVPETLYVDSDRGILVRRYVTGTALRHARIEPGDLPALASELGQWFKHISTTKGPQPEVRPLSVLCSERLRTARGFYPQLVDALTERLLGGGHPCHGDISESNLILLKGKGIALVDAETLDRASMAWDLGHALALASRLGTPLAHWRKELLGAAVLPCEVVKDADLVRAA